MDPDLAASAVGFLAQAPATIGVAVNIPHELRATFGQLVRSKASASPYPGLCVLTDSRSLHGEQSDVVTLLDTALSLSR